MFKQACNFEKSHQNTRCSRAQFLFVDLSILIRFTIVWLKIDSWLLLYLLACFLMYFPNGTTVDLWYVIVACSGNTHLFWLQ